MEYCLLGYFAKLMSPILLLCQVHFAKKLSPPSFYHFANPFCYVMNCTLPNHQVHIAGLPVLQCSLQDEVHVDLAKW